MAESKSKMVSKPKSSSKSKMVTKSKESSKSKASSKSKVSSSKPAQKKSVSQRLAQNKKKLAIAAASLAALGLAGYGASKTERGQKMVSAAKQKAASAKEATNKKAAGAKEKVGGMWSYLFGKKAHPKAPVQPGMMPLFSNKTSYSKPSDEELQKALGKLKHVETKSE